ncbi:hypothetical protein [Tepidibacter formicigenes]|jgi:hypothetical protein|uniref:Lipoprotein n=1 Tax=Tepidibacter formicigenes DSM 15518 TaxID=1123349 RepID=A0A1M6UBU9_9FIRM|nr:hypothetical protein [Tepidibacter formicigenes]SHK66641.1 hypothetical protein SAMN02744037_02771 [Tepidibacter formicigenes DSM 15518]
MMKKLLSFLIIIILGISMSACTFFYKEKVVKPKKKITVKVDNNLKDEPIKTKEELNKKIEEIIKADESIDLSDKNIEKQEIVKDKDKKENTTKKISKKEIINKYKSKFYLLQGEYNGKINGMIAQAKKEYYALPEKDRTTMSKLRIGLKYYNKAKGLEKECDSKVDSTLSSMAKELTESGYSTEAVDLIKNYYENEKSSKRSYYFSKIK